MKKTTQPTILLVDDHKSIREMLKRALERDDCRVDATGSGREAIVKVKTTSYNLALVDLRLPDIDGMEVLRAMSEGNPNTVKIIVTGYPSQESSIEAASLGVDEYVVKPFKPEDFLKTIKKHLQKQQETAKQKGKPKRTSRGSR
jgi:two-component system phosphate regulon sensor histidine kinase PhoR